MIYLSEYTKYLNLIKEGLIRTYNIEKYQGSLDIELNSIGVEYTLNILNKYIYDLELLNPNKFDDSGLNYILNLNKNLLGYYPSYIWVTNEIGTNGFKYKEKYLNNKYKKIKIRFEAKYEDGLYKNDLKIPEYAYHLSPITKKDKILNNGLFLKSFNRKITHPDRIYFFYDIYDYVKLLQMLKLNDANNNIQLNYILYKVKIPQDIIIHSDPNFIGGFYIYDSIPPKNLEIVKENI